MERVTLSLNLILASEFGVLRCRGQYSVFVELDIVLPIGLVLPVGAEASLAELANLLVVFVGPLCNGLCC